MLKWFGECDKDNNDNDMNEVQGFLHLDFGKEGLFVSFECFFLDDVLNFYKDQNKCWEHL